jgi:F-type H+-transporting ATPase subunit g
VARKCPLRKSHHPIPFTTLDQSTGSNILPIPSSTLATFQSYFQPLTNVLRNPAYIKNLSVPSPQGFLNRVRNANAKEIALFGVTAAEVIGFFTVGEIIGRMNIVGYRGETAHH